MKIPSPLDTAEILHAISLLASAMLGAVLVLSGESAKAFQQIQR